MTDDKIKESIRIAEELAKEICTGKAADSPLVEKWKADSPALYEELSKQERLPQEIAFHDSINVESALKETNKRIVSTPRRFSIRTIGIAASFLLIAGAATLWLHTDNRKDVSTEWMSATPGNSNPSIISRDNKAIELTTNKLTIQGDQLISSTLDGKRNVVIDLQPDNQFNKLAVPAGGDYQLTLEDGTVVQVNAASELLFPTHFKQHARQVHLKGEAYFKVKTDKSNPFYVHIGTLNVQVTGTSFNIKAYEEEKDIKITLIEGSVRVREGQKELATLAPGQQFIYRKMEREFNVCEANLSSVADWTEGKFIFYNETISTIMRELSRWYDVDINVSDDIKEVRYSGMLSRKQPLAEILDALRMTQELDFKLHENKKIDAIEKNIK